MLIGILIGVAIALVAIAVVVFGGESAPLWFSLIAVLGIGYWALEREICVFGGDACRLARDTRKQADAAEEKNCATPQPISEAADGVRLYVVRPGGCRDKPIYFSAAGTRTMHSERHGRVTREVEDLVPNAAF